MSSIDTAAIRQLTDPLFDLLIDVWSARQSSLPIHQDPRMDSYYVSRTKPALLAADFLAASFCDEDELACCLASCWTMAGQHGFARHASLVAETASALRTMYREAMPDAEVSPYIYQMF